MSLFKMRMYFTIVPSYCKNCLIFFLMIVSLKTSSADLDRQISNKLNDCSRCELLVKSFNHWLDKTSRGKFEGGDAAWEETKLKSYARSEIRLVEIQEGLCSEIKKHQDSCYAIAEEAEHALEKWWFHQDSNSLDLRTWLCIETLQNCCPQNHFGDSCQLCPMDKNTKLCGGHGRCDGEGTRQGNGSCICHKGYSGTYCETCAENFYSTGLDCKPCDKACDGCSGKGVTLCSACKPGWKMENSVCIDIDECIEPASCKSNQYCVNKEGSYACKLCDSSCKSCMGPGEANCTSCELSSNLWSGVCVDSILREKLLSDSLKKIVLYFVLLLMLLLLLSHRVRAKVLSLVPLLLNLSKALLLMIIVALVSFLYFSETTGRMNTIDVINNLYRLD